jgi:hypothetical protein
MCHFVRSNSVVVHGYSVLMDCNGAQHAMGPIREKN